MINLKQNNINDIYITINDTISGNYPKKLILIDKQTNEQFAFNLGIDLSTNPVRFNYYKIDLNNVNINIGQFDYKIIEDNGFSVNVLEIGLANVYNNIGEIPSDINVNQSTTIAQNDIFTNPNI